MNESTIKNPREQNFSQLPYDSGSEELDDVTMTFSAGDEPKTIQLQPLTMNPGEKLRVTIEKINEDEGTSTPSHEYTFKNNDSKEGETLNQTDIYNMLMMKIENFAIGLFSIASFVFFIMIFFNAFITRADALFCFILCVATAGIFAFDKVYRRNLNSGI